MNNRKLIIPLVLLMLLVPLGVAWAEDDFEVTAVVDTICDDVSLIVDIEGGTGPFSVFIDFGDEDVPIQMEGDAFPQPVFHRYPGQGEYEISVKVIDSEGLEGEFEQEIILEGPEVTLGSDPFPPLLTLEAGEATITFIAIDDGGTEHLAFEWDLDGDENPEIVDPTSSTTKFAYTEAGEYEASVKVTDFCGFTASDKLTVVVLDDELTEDEEEGSEKTCHPMAEKIAQALSRLPNILGSYDCDEIYDIFRGSLTGGAQYGFGRLWHAYKLATVITDLNWEVIRDWKLDDSSWGALNQLNRFAETVSDVGIGDLVDLVLIDGKTVGELRTAMRMSLRYDAIFMDALGRISDGASQGEIGQFYKLVQDLGIDPTVLDGYLAAGDGASLTEVRHASKLAERIGTELDVIMAVHNGGSGWGEISKAQRLADEGIDVASILAIGVNEYRKQLRDEGRLEQLTERDERMTDRNERIVNQFVEKYGSLRDDLMELYEVDCKGSWACVRAVLRDQNRENGTDDKEARTIVRVANQLGVSEAEVSAQLDACSDDWSCVRAYFREGAKPERGKK